MKGLGVAWKWLRHFLSVVGALAIILGGVFLGGASFDKPAPRVLADHPKAEWLGAEDGGYYVEITRSNPPDYWVQVRYESGSLLSEGWIRYGTQSGTPLTVSQISSADIKEISVTAYLPITKNKGDRRQ
ncbi:hypothetical protein [Pseudomonas purpurea]|uniref:hypothetical protein n=1 Tax=Pseudomonas purpurea TaxID=3136737 RepID=UPI0032677BDC